jgi:hypothetical protein
MADQNAVHITATDMRGEIVHDSYVKPSRSRYAVKLLKEEGFIVKTEIVTELPKGVELAE